MENFISLLKIFMCLFGCIGFQLWHTGSSLCRCEVFCCSAQVLQPWSLGSRARRSSGLWRVASRVRGPAVWTCRLSSCIEMRRRMRQDPELLSHSCLWNILEQWVLKSSPCSSIACSPEDIGDADSQSSPQTSQVRNSGMGPTDLCTILSPGEAEAGSSLRTSVL